MALSSEVLLTSPPEAAKTKKEGKMRTKFAILLAIAVVCVSTVRAGWAAEEQVTRNKYKNSLGMCSGHRAVVDKNGVRHLVWDVYKQSNWVVYYKRYYPGSGWTADTLLTTISSSTSPSIALDSNGTTIHVVWEGLVKSGRSSVKDVFYMKCVPSTSGNGGWIGPPKDLTPKDGEPRHWDPVVACFQDHVVVSWEDAYTSKVGFCECISGIWQSPSHLEVAGTDEMAWGPSIAVDPQGRHGDVFISYGLTYAQDGEDVYVIRRVGGVWRSPENATDFPVSGISYFNPSIEVDPSTGYPHIVSGSNSSTPYYYSHIYHTYWDLDLGGWQPVEMISEPSAYSDVDQMPSMFFGGGTAYVVWGELSSLSGPDSGIKYSVRDPGTGEWSPPDWITNYASMRPSVTVSPNGAVYVVWEDGRAQPTQIWGRLYAPGSFGGQAEPAATSRPGVELFPNPAKAGRVTVQYSLPRAEPLRVTVLDVSGRAVRTQEVGAAGRSGSFSVDVSGLNAGVYILKLESGTSSLTRKLVIQ